MNISDNLGGNKPLKGNILSQCLEQNNKHNKLEKVPYRNTGAVIICYFKELIIKDFERIMKVIN